MLLAGGWSHPRTDYSAGPTAHAASRSLGDELLINSEDTDGGRAEKKIQTQTGVSWRNGGTIDLSIPNPRDVRGFQVVPEMKPHDAERL